MSQTAAMRTFLILASDRIRARQRPPVPMQATLMTSLASAAALVAARGAAPACARNTRRVPLMTGSSRGRARTLYGAPFLLAVSRSSAGPSPHEQLHHHHREQPQTDHRVDLKERLVDPTQVLWPD